MFAGSGGVEFRLQKLIEHPYAAFALLGRAEHLHLPDGIEVQEARQAGGAERDDTLRRVGRGDGALKEKVAAFRVEPRRFAAVDAVGVVDDHALFILPENLGQADGGDRAAVQNVAQHVARADAGELIRVADHNQPRAGDERAQKRPHQEDIHHGHFVDDERVVFQRVILRAGEVALLAAVFQQAVERLGLHAAGLAHALGGAAGRCGQRDITVDAEQLDDALDDRRLARAGAAGDDGHAAGDGGFDGLPLLGVKGDALHALQLVDLRGQVGRHRIRHGVDHLPQAARDLAFGAIG